MERKEIYDRICSIIEKEFDITVCNENMYLDNTPIGLELDSMQIVMLITLVEENFNIIIDYDVEFHMISDILDWLEKSL